MGRNGVSVVLQGVGAVIAGFAAMAAIVMIGEWLIRLVQPTASVNAAAGMPGATYLALNLTAGTIAALTGGVLASWLAPQAPLWHAIALAALVCIMGLVSAGMAGDAQPRWYQAVLYGVMPVIVIAGGWASTQSTWGAAT